MSQGGGPLYGIAWEDTLPPGFIITGGTKMHGPVRPCHTCEWYEDGHHCRALDRDTEAEGRCELMIHQ